MAKHILKLGDDVRIICSGETGQVVGRAEYTNANPQCFVRYMAADGRAVEQWWNDDALEMSAPATRSEPDHSA